MRAPESVDPTLVSEIEDDLLGVLNDLDIDIDIAETVWLPLASGRLQPVVWPMLLHRHGNDCGRA